MHVLILLFNELSYIICANKKHLIRLSSESMPITQLTTTNEEVESFRESHEVKWRSSGFLSPI